MAWDPDGKGFLYSRHPAPGEVPKSEEPFHEKIFHHRLGADPAADPVVFDGAGRPVQEVRNVWTSSDERWAFLTASVDWAKNDLWIRAAGSDQTFQPVAVGLDGSTSGDAADGILQTTSFG